MNSFKLLALFCGILCCGLLTGCGSAGPPHTEYFIVTFVPGTQELSAQGTLALANAESAGTSGRPGSVEIRGVAPDSDEAVQALERRRADAVMSSLVKAGVPPGIVQTEIQPVPASVYARQGDDLIVAIGYGKRPKQP